MDKIRAFKNRKRGDLALVAELLATLLLVERVVRVVLGPVLESDVGGCVLADLDPLLITVQDRNLN